jgi:ABC-type transporter Mla maintaining outer membrane lipid asymmetry ATPase subunit MlaF
MITARAGSAMTAEIGIQRISEQVDALSTMRIDLSVYEGEVTTLIGLSGTGKSVTLKHIIGMWSYPF